MAAATLSQRCGDWALAAALIDDALDITDDPQLRAALEHLRMRVRWKSPTRDVLTSRELSVALLVAHGRTNQEAAAALFVSPKTVEFHLGNVYRKLSVRSRTEMARILVADGRG